MIQLASMLLSFSEAFTQGHFFHRSQQIWKIVNWNNFSITQQNSYRKQTTHMYPYQLDVECTRSARFYWVKCYTVISITLCTCIVPIGQCGDKLLFSMPTIFAQTCNWMHHIKARKRSWRRVSWKWKINILCWLRRKECSKMYETS